MTTTNDNRVDDYEIDISAINKKYPITTQLPHLYGSLMQFFMVFYRSVDVFNDFFAVVTGDFVVDVLEGISEVGDVSLSNLVSFVVGVSTNAANT